MHLKSPLHPSLPLWLAVVCGIAAVGWWRTSEPLPEARIPVERPAAATASSSHPANPGTLVAGPGTPSSLTGVWDQFMGPGRDNIVRTAAPRTQAWPGDAPRELWRISVGEGHAGAAIRQGRVYLVDYDREKEEDAIVCLSLDDGREIWRYSYSESIKRNHGMSRTVPAVTDRYVVAITPKCKLICLDAISGELQWKIDMVEKFGTVIPPWYAGQCPLIDGDRVIVAPGARPLMLAIGLATGQTVWQTPDHEEMGMTHSSVVPFESGGHRQYVYCTGQGAVGVSAEDGRVLWTKPDWKIGIANIPSPVPAGPDRLFFTGGYDSGSMMLRLTPGAAGLAAEEVFRLKPIVFASDQQTPIFYDGHLYAVIPSGEMVCLDLDGQPLWSSGIRERFGLGPYLCIGGLLYVLDDEEGTLHCLRADPAGYQELGRAKLLNGHDAWGPMAYADGRLILRDLTEMICVEI